MVETYVKGDMLLEEDKILMKKFQEGNDEAFEKLIVKYRTSAVYFAQRYTNDKYIAEDITQESFAYLYVYKDRYNEKYSFKTYLFTIIHNKSIDHIRKSKREELNDNLYRFNSLDNPEELLIKHERKHLVIKNINKLKEDYKTAIYLIDYERFSYKEAGIIMGKNSAQMKILIFRARKKLKLLIEQEGYVNE